MIQYTRMTRRPGVTLLEVLTAIFIMGVGLLAILTLFPLGALSMARAVRDDRAAAAGANASAAANAHDLRNDPNLVPLLSSSPDAALYPLAPDGPGFPVFVDPAYVLLGAGPLGASTTSPGIRRGAPIYATNASSIARWFTFQDEITFETNGTPKGGGTVVYRPGTYSWAYLVRRPRPSSPALTDIAVVVYANRATDSVLGETTVTSATATPLGTAGTNTVAVSFPAGTDKPNIRKGSWILDTSLRAVPGGTTVNGFFYQVASVTDTGATSMTLELEAPLKENVTTVVLMENVITVLDRGTSSRP
jgi:prepilin-type N-terminal cleavage/methylation domain-containing protein